MNNKPIATTLVLTLFVLAALPMFGQPAGAAEGHGGADRAAPRASLQYDTIKSGYSEVIVSVTLPDGGKVTRVTEPVEGRDGKEGGLRKLVGYRLPDGTVVDRDIRRNTDGTVTVLDVDNGRGSVDRHPKRMTEDEFVRWVKDNEKQK